MQYGNSVVLLLNHFVVVLMFLVLAWLCNHTVAGRLIYSILVFLFGVNMWLAAGWNIVRALGTFAGW